MQSCKIVLTCVFAAVLYGIIHDQFTAHICVEYFSVFHPPVFSTTSPALLALGWGVIATWWMGAFLGVLLAIAARAGSRQQDRCDRTPSSNIRIASGDGLSSNCCGARRVLPGGARGYSSSRIDWFHPASCETCTIHGGLVGAQRFVLARLFGRNFAVCADHPQEAA